MEFSPSRGPVKMGVTLDGPCDGFIQANHRLVTHVPFGSLAAIIMEGPREGNPHGSEGGVDGNKGTQQQQNQGEEKG